MYGVVEQFTLKTLVFEPAACGSVYKTVHVKNIAFDPASQERVAAECTNCPFELLWLGIW